MPACVSLLLTCTGVVAAADDGRDGSFCFGLASFFAAVKPELEPAAAVAARET